MPIVEGDVYISSIVGVEHEYLRKHSFTGANAYMINILKDNSEELQVRAEPQQLENAISRIEEQMREDVGTIEIKSLEIKNGKILVEVLIESSVGHKFPTGYPSRRVWLHFTVMDSAGNMLFESGAFEANGLIVGNDNDADASVFEPHYETISEAAQVQIYETIMENSDGEVTTTLLRAAAYSKDNRILPSGFDFIEVSKDISVYGEASVDKNFKDGSDSIVYKISVDDFEGPFTIKVELLYQSIGYRWANNLRQYDSQETNQFIEYYDETDNLPLLVDEAEATIEN